MCERCVLLQKRVILLQCKANYSLEGIINSQIDQRQFLNQKFNATSEILNFI